jgi:hypothetical protein
MFAKKFFLQTCPPKVEAQENDLIFFFEYARALRIIALRREIVQNTKRPPAKERKKTEATKKKKHMNKQKTQPL